MCSSTDREVAKSQTALMEADAAATKTYQQQASLAFSEQQSVLNSLNVKLSYIAANPLGYTPKELHLMTTNVNEQTAAAAKQAIGAAAAFAATHGAADVGGGATGQIAGEIGSEAAQSKARSLSDIAMQSEQLKQQNYWKAISGLSGVGGDFGSATSASGGLGVGSSGAATNAGAGAVSASSAEFADIGSIISGAAGLGKAVSGFIPGLNKG